MDIPKSGKDFRFVSDHRVVNATTNQVTFLMLNLKSEAGIYANATAIVALNLLQGYCQIPLRGEAKSTSSIIPSGG